MDATQERRDYCRRAGSLTHDNSQVCEEIWIDEMMDLAILVPTRGRPDNAKRLRKQLSDTSSGFSNIGIFFLVDDNDPTAHEYESLRNMSTVVHIGPSKRLG